MNDTQSECETWLLECLEVFPEIKRKKILITYKQMRARSLGYVRAFVEKKLDFDAEELLLGIQSMVKEKKSKPKEYNIFINDRMQKIKNTALRKQVVQSVIIHELLHISGDDLFTVSKEYSKRKKKKIHVKEFEEESFKRFNELRVKKGIMQIAKKEYLDQAISRTLESIGWYS